MDEATRPAGEGEPEAESADDQAVEAPERATPPIDEDVAGPVNAALPDSDD